MWKSWIFKIGLILSIGNVLLFQGCIFNPNIDAGNFVCTTDDDCPDDWVCYASLNRCYKKDAKNIPLPDAGGDPCAVEGQERSCYTGPLGTKSVGLCKPGLQVCKDGRWSACDGQVTPAKDDPCDNQDNDCNGIIDDGCPCTSGKKRSCFSGLPTLPGKGICKRGTQTCIGNKWGACEGQVLPTTEICDNSDNDCNGKIDDGISPKRCYTGPPTTLGKGRCTAGQAYCKNGKFDDCVGQILPAKEVCENQIDDDCDGSVDEDCGCKPGDVQVCYSGSDSTRGKGECRAGTQRCKASGAWGPCQNQILPKPEDCDGLDNDCDGRTDEDLKSRPCYTGTPGTSGTGPCKDGIQACTNGTWGQCRGEVTPSAEVCDKSDNDCDGTIDEGCQCIVGDKRACYSGPPGTSSRGICKSGTQTCQSTGKWSACVGEVKPSKEVCDGKDNDCDGTIDSYSRSCFDGDPSKAGKGICRPGAQTCSNGKWSVCLGQILPSSESCDGIDNDCDGKVDGVQRKCYNASTGCKSDGSGNYTCTGACAPGQQVCTKGAWSTCKGATEPSREVCDNKDNDCDGNIDGYNETCYTGADKGCLPDGKGGYFCKGLCKSGKRSCTAGKLTACQGQVIGTKELCDGKDNNCDGFVDEGCNCLNGQTRTCYTGSTGTAGKGVCKSGTQTCTGGQWGTCAGQVVPSAELCNNKDDDCDGSIDETVTRTCFTGPAGSENKGICKSGTQTCNAGKWGVCAGQRLPKTEVCDGKDNDCNGKTDDNLKAPACAKQQGVCKGAVQRCGGSQGWLKCAATEYGKEYQLSETNCDGKDNDCDGKIDGNKACGFCIQSAKAAVFSATLPSTCKATDSCFDGCRWYKGQTYYCRNNDGKGFKYVSYNHWIQACNAANACTTSLCSTVSYFCDGNAWRKGTKPGTNDDFCDGLDNNCNGKIDENCTCQSVCTADKHCKGSCKRCVKSVGSLFPRCVP